MGVGLQPQTPTPHSGIISPYVSSLVRLISLFFGSSSFRRFSKLLCALLAGLFRQHKSLNLQGLLRHEKTIVRRFGDVRYGIAAGGFIAAADPPCPGPGLPPRSPLCRASSVLR